MSICAENITHHVCSEQVVLRKKYDQTKDVLRIMAVTYSQYCMLQILGSINKTAQLIDRPYVGL